MIPLETIAYFLRRYKVYSISCIGLFLFFAACVDAESPEAFKQAAEWDIVRIPASSTVESLPVSLEQSRETAITRAVKNAADAIVSVGMLQDSLDADPATRRSGKSGESYSEDVNSPVDSWRSGFFISGDGHILTHSESVPDSNGVWVVFTRDGERHLAENKGSDPWSGIQLLKIHAEQQWPYMRFANSDSLMIGEWGIALGIQGPEVQNNHYPSVTAGVVSSLDCMVEPADNPGRFYPDLIRTDALITPEAQGGPVLNAGGRVIGMSVYIPAHLRNDTFEGPGYAIPGNKVARMANYLAVGSEVHLDYSMGLEMVPVTRRLASHYGLPARQGLLVLGVNRDGPAFESGILPGDVIIRIGNQLIHGEPHAWAVLRQFRSGDRMRLTLIRDEEELHVKVVLRKRLSEYHEKK